MGSVQDKVTRISDTAVAFASVILGLLGVGDRGPGNHFTLRAYHGSASGEHCAPAGAAPRQNRPQ